MGQPAVNQDQLPANDSNYTDAVDADEQEMLASKSLQPSANNAITRVIEELRDITGEIDDLRELLRAHGVPHRTSRMIVELGLQNNPDKQALVINAAMQELERKFGAGGLTREALESHCDTMLDLEKNLTHSKAAARQEGLDTQALTMLLRMIQQSPSDNGAKPVNTLLAYALAYGVNTEKLREIAGQITSSTNSVLPQISRKASIAESYTTRNMIHDSLIGLLIGVCVIYFLV